MVIDLILNSKYLGDCFDFIATTLCDDFISKFRLCRAYFWGDRISGDIRD